VVYCHLLCLLAATRAICAMRGELGYLGSLRQVRVSLRWRMGRKVWDQGGGFVRLLGPLRAVLVALGFGVGDDGGGGGADGDDDGESADVDVDATVRSLMLIMEQSRQTLWCPSRQAL
jgi:hypothetical protein